MKVWEKKRKEEKFCSTFGSNKKRRKKIEKKRKKKVFFFIWRNRVRENQLKVFILHDHFLFLSLSPLAQLISSRCYWSGYEKERKNSFFFFLLLILRGGKHWLCKMWTKNVWRRKVCESKATWSRKRKKKTKKKRILVSFIIGEDKCPKFISTIVNTNMFCSAKYDPYGGS